MYLALSSPLKGPGDEANNVFVYHNRAWGVWFMYNNCIDILFICWVFFISAEDDFHEIYEEIVSITAEYYKLGIGLRLKLGELQAICKSRGQDIDQAFTDVLLAWLRQRYDIAKYGPPTWRMLVKAVDSPAGGNNHTLAMTISHNHAISGKGHKSLCLYAIVLLQSNDILSLKVEKFFQTKYF